MPGPRNPKYRSNPSCVTFSSGKYSPKRGRFPIRPARTSSDSKKNLRTSEKNENVIQRHATCPYACRETLSGRFECDAQLSSLFLSACSPLPLAGAQTAAAERGMKVYAESKCSMCHAVAGKGNAKGVLDDVGAKLSADEIRQWLVDPAAMTAKAHAERKPPMKSYASLPKGDLDATGGVPADAEGEKVTGDARSIRSSRVSRQPSRRGLRLHDCGDGLPRLALSHSAGKR